MNINADIECAKAFLEQEAEAENMDIDSNEYVEAVDNLFQEYCEMDKYTKQAVKDLRKEYKNGTN